MLSIVCIIEIFKVIVQLSFGIILFRKWITAENHFYTDIPFLFSITLLSIGSGEFIDVLIDGGLVTLTLLEYKIRLLVILPASVAIVFFISMIWLREAEKKIIAITSIYGTAYAITVLLATSIETLMFYISILLAIMMLPGIITFLIIWLLKRLPNVNSFLIFLGATIILIGQLAEGVFLPPSYLWVSELIDLVGWSLMFLSLYILPHYKK